MQIDQIRLITTAVTLVSPLRTSDGEHASRQATLIEIRDSEGKIGWGENVAPVGVDYVGQSQAESVAVMRDQLIPILVRRQCDVLAMNPATWWGLDNCTFSKHALESAMWDLWAQHQNMSLAQVLGGTRSHIYPGVVVGLADNIDETLAECDARLQQGYQRLKLKIAPGRDVDLVRAVRLAFGDDFVLQVDANGAYHAADIDHLCRLANWKVQFIEQPFGQHDFESHVALSSTGSVRVCLDESIMTRDDLEHALDQGACSVVNIKPSRVGGLGEAVAMHDIVMARGVDAWVGGMLETGIGRASCLALASLPGFTLTPDLSASDRYFAHDVTEPFVLREGAIAVPTGIGLGVSPRSEVLQDPSTTIETVYEA